MQSTELSKIAPEHQALKSVYADLTKATLALVLKDPARAEYALLAALLDRLHDEVLVPLDEKLGPACDGGRTESATAVVRV